jgi:hypothetical protein
MENGVTEVKFNQPFIVKMANYGNKPILLPKHFILGMASPLSVDVLSISETTLPSETQETRVKSMEEIK